MGLDKPAFGSPCNGCGVCCMAEPCPVAVTLIDAKDGPCPALEFKGGRHWCGLLTNAHLYIDGLEGKPWASDGIATYLMATGAWSGVCDSG